MYNLKAGHLDYTYVRELGRGNSTIVVEVESKYIKKHFAMKIVNFSMLEEKEKQKYFNEAKLLSSLKSNYILQYKEAFLDMKNLILVNELADFGQLELLTRKLHGKQQFFHENFIWRIVHQISLALQVLHSNKIIHCNLKVDS